MNANRVEFTLVHPMSCLRNLELNWQNGYTGRRRSLVDDARFETKVNKENRESLNQQPPHYEGNYFDTV